MYLRWKMVNSLSSLNLKLTCHYGFRRSENVSVQIPSSVFSTKLWMLPAGIGEDSILQMEHFKWMWEFSELHEKLTDTNG